MPYLRTIIFCLIGLVAALQYALWFGKSNVVDLIHLRHSVNELSRRISLSESAIIGSMPMSMKSRIVSRPLRQERASNWA